jgi:hypothetical protein
MMIKMLVVCCRVYEKGKANVTFVAKLADDLTTFCGAGYENYFEEKTPSRVSGVKRHQLS